MALAALAAALLVTVAPAVLPATAEAATTGRVCLFLDEQGANPLDQSKGFGHTAWAIRDPKSPDHWIWGATEGFQNKFQINAGYYNGSWIEGGTWRQLRGEDPTSKKRKIDLIRYDSYRCVNTASGDLGAAQRTFNNMKANGYNGLYNNCLTKALAIFRMYSPALSSAHMPDGYATAPRYYFYSTLNGARGWEKPRQY
ncbi:hypothetical protein Sros01_74620 [Streptomyces roseochromogenus]|nr:hypothetical protein Sros01_74620 [Streptomyces roseochromogenus]